MTKAHQIFWTCSKKSVAGEAVANGIAKWVATIAIGLFSIAIEIAIFAPWLQLDCISLKRMIFKKIN